MNYFMFQEKNGIKLHLEEYEKDSQGAYKGVRNMDICCTWVSGGQESYLHMEFIISSIPGQRVSTPTIGWSKYWIEQRDIQKQYQVWATLDSY